MLFAFLSFYADYAVTILLHYATRAAYLNLLFA